MGRRRRNRKKKSDPLEQGELLEGVEGEAESDDPVESEHSEADTAEDEADPVTDGGEAERASDAGEEPDTDDGDVDSEEGEASDPADVHPAESEDSAPALRLSSDWQRQVAELEDIHDLEAALALVRAEREVSPDEIGLLRAEIRLLGSLGRFDAAEAPLAHLRRTATDKALVHRVAGLLLFRRGTYAEALEELRASVAMDDSVGETFYYLGETLNRLGRSDGALEALHRAVELDPQLGRAYSTMGRLLDQQGRPDEAAVMHRKARESHR